VENVTFRLDALDIEELSGSLNLGNNFDVQIDPQSLFRGGKAANRNEGAGTDTPSAGRTKSDANSDRADEKPGDPGESMRRTASGFSYRPSASSAPDR
jgi:hypothetical protein